MYLKALEIQGFKSFPDKTVLNFGEDITAIVGPNGSGKSNISDAIRWVMGEQNSRQLRGAKMEDVIFGGTEKRSQMGFAQVTLVIDNTEHIFPTRDEAEVADGLSREYGIMTRVGLHCAPSAHKTLGTFPEGTIRLSLGYFNTANDVDAAVTALEELLD